VILDQELKEFVTANYGGFYEQNYQKNLITDPETFEPILKQCVWEKRGIRIVGEVGSGKTFLTIRYLELLKEAIGEQPLWTLVDVYHESQIYKILKKGGTIGFKKIVIIDDFLSVKFPEWMVSDYEYIYHCLHSAIKILVITTNVEDKVARSTYERAYSRIVEMTTGYLLPAVDRRIQR
jgi:DNA replication protein DnaC